MSDYGVFVFSFEQPSASMICRFAVVRVCAYNRILFFSQPVKFRPNVICIALLLSL